MGKEENPGKVWGAGAGKALENLAEMILSTGDSVSAAECPLNLGHEYWLVSVFEWVAEQLRRSYTRVN